MNTRIDLLNSIAATINTFRSGEIPAPTPEHVDRWVRQFSPNNQLPILQEFNHVISKSFYSKEKIVSQLRDLINTVALTGADPASYWRRVNFLNIQQHGDSQNTMLNLFSEQLLTEFGFSIDQCGQLDGDYIYLDDIAFTGDRAGCDLTSWILAEAPKNCTLRVIFLVRHTSCYYMENVRISHAIEQSSKNISVTHWYGQQVENRKERRNISNVYWPVVVPPEVLNFYPVTNKFSHIPRTPPGNLEFFSSESGRQILESEFLLAGVRIRQEISNPRDILKPLGYSNFGLGFGSTLVTYRNCPNTAPLAIWWGQGQAYGPMQWYPLLPRRTYTT